MAKFGHFRRGYYYISNIIYYQALGQAACGLWLSICQPMELEAELMVQMSRWGCEVCINMSQKKLSKMILISMTNFFYN